jgi:carboxypeptidase D
VSHPIPSFISFCLCSVLRCADSFAFLQYPVLWDVLGNPGTNPDVQSPIYFDRADVKKAIHAPANVAWEECTGRAKTFPFDDASEPSALNALPKAIERSPKGVVIMHGMADFLLLADGTRTVIQK